MFSSNEPWLPLGNIRRHYVKIFFNPERQKRRKNAATESKSPPHTLRNRRRRLALSRELGLAENSLLRRGGVARSAGGGVDQQIDFLERTALAKSPVRLRLKQFTQQKCERPPTLRKQPAYPRGFSHPFHR